jgi:hypothetical protein
LGVDLFIGLGTLGRMASASAEEIHCVRGMNRIRHAYLEIAPDLEPYFITNQYDDPASILATYAIRPDQAAGSGLASLAHGLTTSPGMIAVIDMVIAAALGFVIAIGAGFDWPIIAAASIGVAVAAFLIASAILTRSVRGFVEGVPVRFPAPPRVDASRPPTPPG